MEINQLIEKMKTPSMMTPAEIKDSYMELSSYYAQITAELADTTAELNVLRRQYLEDDEIPHNKAETFALGTDTGVKYTKLKGREKAILEVIRSLKVAQRYFENEARNNF
jgi:hypothetical protein